DLEDEDLIEREDMVVTVTQTGWIKRTPLAEFRSQRRGGKGLSGMQTKDEDFVEQLYVSSTHDYFLVFTDHGKLYWLKVYQIPQAGRTAKGKAIVNLLQLSASNEKVVTVLPVREFEEGLYVVMITRKGIIKKTDLMAFSNIRSAGIIALDILEGDDLVYAGLSNGDQEIFIATRDGMSIRFHESDVRGMGRTARGVKGISLKGDDEVVDAFVAETDNPILTVCDKGFGKRTDMEDYRLQSRGGSGIITIKTTDRNGGVIGFMQVDDVEQLMMITEQGKIIRMGVDQMRVMGRNTQGVRMFDLTNDDRVVSVSRLPEAKDEDDEDEDDEGDAESGSNGESAHPMTSDDLDDADEPTDDSDDDPDGTVN
ncbi:DNA gyrase subunit A, partial [bacterium]|nr:DNA gyrase subunit A [bacterium]